MFDDIQRKRKEKEEARKIQAKVYEEAYTNAFYKYNKIILETLSQLRDALGWEIENPFSHERNPKYEPNRKSWALKLFRDQSILFVS